jgi:hypothetical protein
MTYVELITVLAIMSVMSSVVLYNYRDFQSKVEVKSLSNEVALKIVEIQKGSMSGKLAPQAQQQIIADSGILNWRPSYGLYFSTNENVRNRFLYFADLDNSVLLKNPAYNIMSSECDRRECMDVISMPKNYYVSGLKVFCNATGAIVVPPVVAPENDPNAKGDAAASEEVKVLELSLSDYARSLDGVSAEKGKPISEVAVRDLSVTFIRPDSKAYIQTYPDSGCASISHAVINLSASGSTDSSITVYPSGRVQIK